MFSIMHILYGCTHRWDVKNVKFRTINHWLRSITIASDGVLICVLIFFRHVQFLGNGQQHIHYDGANHVQQPKRVFPPFRYPPWNDVLINCLRKYYSIVFFFFVYYFRILFFLYYL